MPVRVMGNDTPMFIPSVEGNAMKKHYAKDEISKEEFERMKDDIAKT